LDGDAPVAAPGVITLAQLNALAPVEFAAALDGIFEHTCWVAQRTAAGRPFASRLQLLDAMRSAVDQAPAAEQLALIRAHPKLGVRTDASPLTPASAREQRRAGLTGCTAAEVAQLQQLNARYQERFGFPFIVAVRGHDPASIIAHMQQRLGNDGELERLAALTQIGAIAAYRLADRIGSAPGAEVIAMLERLARHGEPAIASGTITASSAVTALVREWMLAAGLAVWPAVGGSMAGGYLIGRAIGGESAGQTLLAGACRSVRRNTVRYLGSAEFVIAIEAAQQLRLTGARAALGLAVLARPHDARVDSAGSGPIGAARQDWIGLDGIASEAAGDGETMEIRAALRAAELPDSAALLVRVADATPGQRSPGQLTADAAGRAVQALVAMLGRAQTAA
jgi:OHCU decarboxylase